MKWSQLFYLGGYAWYVWPSYALALILMAGEVILVRRRRKQLEGRRGHSRADD
jgi:heme exporter protein CcmD